MIRTYGSYWRRVWDLNPRGPKGHRLSRPASIDYLGVREDFRAWLGNRAVSESYRRQILSYLERFLAGRVIEGPMDVVRVFKGLSPGQSKNLNRALRNFFNFLECMGWSPIWLDLLRRNIPKDQLGEDLYRPTEDRILESLRLMEVRAQEKYRLLYWLILESGGLRLIEAVRFYNTAETLEVEVLPGGSYVKVLLGYFRGTKRAYYAYLSHETHKKVVEASAEHGAIKYRNARSYLKKHLYSRNRKAVTWKYLRKYAYDKLLELGVPESVADFIQGRVPKKIGAKHYLDLRRRADQYYPRYGHYIIRLRAEALTGTIAK